MGTNNRTTNDVAETVTDSLSEDRVTDLLEEVEVEIDKEGGLTPLGDVMADTIQGHYELSAYKSGALTTVEALDEEIALAESRDDEDLAELLYEIREATFAIYLRIERGDAELYGDRDGAYSNFLREEGAEPVDDPDHERRVIVNESLQEDC